MAVYFYIGFQNQLTHPHIYSIVKSATAPNKQEKGERKVKEKVLVKSYSPKAAKLILVMFIIGAILSTLIFVGEYLDNQSSFSYYKETYESHQKAGSCGRYYDSWEQCYTCRSVEKYSSAFTMTLAEEYIWTPLIVLPLLGLVIKLLMSSFSLTVTDKRVYCKVLWIHHVSLPVDYITAAARISLFGIVAISSPSGHIIVAFVKNAKEIYETVNDLLIERQVKPVTVVPAVRERKAPTSAPEA